MAHTLAVIGGALQGLEAVCLAREAGFHTLLVDRDPHPPARTLADEFVQLDVRQAGTRVADLLTHCDLVLPTTESTAALTALQGLTTHPPRPIAFDWDAYAITASKKRSNDLFRRIGIPMPTPWPDCGFPVLAKPAAGSGSTGVARFDHAATLEAHLKAHPGEWVLQELLQGPSYSLEVLGHRDRVTAFQVTELHFDAVYDCKRVLAGPHTGGHVEGAFADLAARIAAALGLRGIMDIEVIEERGRLKVLEIDARLPSQTPSAVYYSTGINLLEQLAQYWMTGRLPIRPPTVDPPVAVLYEHYRFRDGVLTVGGEHVLQGARELRLHPDRFSAHVLISNQEAFPADWVATAVYRGETEQLVWQRRSAALRELRETFRPRLFLDPEPPEES